MDRHELAAQSRILRGITGRLSNSNPSLPSQLIVNAQRSVADVAFCKTLLTTPEDKLKISQTEAGVVVHSFKTKLSSLLQDRTSSSRLAAIILIKATVHIGGYEVLNKNCAVWVRALLNILAKPGAVQTKRLIIIVLVQIYRATDDLPNLTREVTTPTLKDFIPACLNLVTTQKTETSQRLANLHSQLLPDVLHAFVQLLPRHPTVFRPFSATLVNICGSVISLTSAQGNLFLSTVRPESHSLARRLLGQLPRCAPRNTATEEWSKTVRLLKEHIANTADGIFRSIIETSSPSSTSARRHTTSQSKPSEQPTGHLEDDLHLSGWTGLDPGVDRLISLLRTLQAFISTPGPSAVPYTLPVDMILNVLERLLNVFPGQRLEALSVITPNADTSREERDLLFLRSHQIQMEVLKTLEVLCRRLGSTSMSVASGALESIVWCFGSGVRSARLRATYYDAATALVKLCGSGSGRKLVQSLNEMIRAASNDIWMRTSAAGDKNARSSQAGQNSADAYLTVIGERQLHLVLGPAHESAKSLMGNLLKYIPAESMSNENRALIDKSIVLCRDEESMLASVLNVSSQRGLSTTYHSIMPFLAREHAESVRVEAIIRPRFPPLATKLSSARGSVENVDYESDQQGGSSLHNRHFHDDREVSDPGDENMEVEASDPAIMAVPAPNAVTAVEKPPAYEISLNNQFSDTTSQVSCMPPARESAQSPKRARTEDDTGIPNAEPKRVKLATFEAAPGPTSVAVISETRRQGIAGSHNEDNHDSDSDGSSLPSINMADPEDTDADDDDDE